MRPSVDTLFRSAARAYGPKVVGVVLSGTLDDGTIGLLGIKEHHGVAVVQTPEDAIYEGMPRSAIKNVDVDYIVPIDEMGPLLYKLVTESVPELKREVSAAMSDDVEADERLIRNALEEQERGERSREASMFTCPDCGGVLWEIDSGKLIRFRCHVGHTYSIEGLTVSQSESMEVALWAAVRALKESASLARRVANRLEDRGDRSTVKRFRERAEAADHHADTLRDILQKSAQNPEELDQADLEIFK